MIDDTFSYPGYVTVTPTDQGNYIWAASTSDVRGLQKASSPGDRIAATWYASGSFTIDLNFNDGAQHQLAVSCLDWDLGAGWAVGRVQTVSVLDAATNGESLSYRRSLQTIAGGAVSRGGVTDSRKSKQEGPPYQWPFPLSVKRRSRTPATDAYFPAQRDLQQVS